MAKEKKKKEKSLKDVEAEAMGQFPGAELTEEEKQKQAEMDGKKRDGELPGMPEKTSLEKQTDKVVGVWEDLKTIQETLREEKDKLLPLMKEEGRLVLNLKDSGNNSLEIKVTSSDEKISITKKREIQL